MAVLVIAEHDNASLKPATLNAVTAAKELSDDIHVLVAGHQADAAAKEAAAVAGVTKVLHAESEAQAHPLAENLAPLIVELAGNYSHVIATATTTMKNVMPRAARPARRCTDLRCLCDRVRGHLRAPDLCGQRTGDRTDL